MKRFLLPFVALPLLAGLCAWVGNATASPRRRVTWVPQSAAPAPAVAAPPVVTPKTTPPVPAPSAPQAPAAARPTPTPMPGTAKPPAAKPPAPSTAPTAPETAAKRFPFDPDHLEREISSEEALEAFRLGVLFFDARRSEEFEAGHIAGAHSVPVWEDGLTERLVALEGRPGFPPRKARLATPVLVYCSGGACEDSHLLAEQLFPLGFGNVLIYTGGFPDWAAKGRPVARGPEAP
ncbi:MAG TPA: rhodanese-like domain-containing protein [Holophagaceae bacterium]|nr:rhodanese-like domain-containing protein [Holophagaceae bacterium]